MSGQQKALYPKGCRKYPDGDVQKILEIALEFNI
jgi:hypothetical protein